MKKRKAETNRKAESGKAESGKKLQRVLLSVSAFPLSAFRFFL